MKLEFKSLNLESGRPIAFVSSSLAKKIKVYEGARIEVAYRGTKLILPINILGKFLSEHQISFSQEAVDHLRLRAGANVEVYPALETQSSRYILKKLDGKELSKKEIYSIIKDVVDNALNEAEIAYFVSGVYHHGMSFKETIFLTEAMAQTGRILKWPSMKIADKHSIGGVPGNRTTPIVVSICAAAGVIIPKTSSRAITTAAATADVIEAVTNVSLSDSELQQVVKKTGACLAWGGSLGLAPSDDKLIRIEKMLNLDPEPQLIASILSKKLATGSKYIVLDIPYGPGAKVTFEQAKKLKLKFLKIAKHLGLKLRVLLTDGSQPIGNAVGPVLEMIDVYKILRRENPPRDLEEKSIFLAAQILELLGKSKKGNGQNLAKQILDSGKALKKFEEIISAQGKKSEALKLAKFNHKIITQKAGKIISIDNKLINYLARILGCPKSPTAGLYLHKHVGGTAGSGEPLLTLYAESKKRLIAGAKFCREHAPIKIS